MHTQKHIHIRVVYNMSVVKKVRQKEKMFTFLFHSSFNDNVWTVGCKRHDWRIINVEFESNLHHFYRNMLFSNSSEEHCIIQMFSFQAKIQNVCLSNIKHDSQSKHHSMKQKRTKKQQPRSENCVTTTYLCHIFPQFCFQALHICFLLLFFFQNPLET